MHSYTMDRNDARSTMFSEQDAFWTIPLHETSVVADVAVTKGTDSSELGVIHICCDYGELCM